MTYWTSDSWAFAFSSRDWKFHNYSLRMPRIFGNKDNCGFYYSFSEDSEKWGEQIYIELVSTSLADGLNQGLIIAWKPEQVNEV